MHPKIYITNVFKINMKRFYLFFLIFFVGIGSIFGRSRIPQSVSTKVTDTIIVVDGTKYRLALSGAVNMGTGRPYWAACNVGARSPEEYGAYFAWGEYNSKREYTWDNYKYAYTTPTDIRITKYGRGIDGRWTLTEDDDAATQNWGGLWRMPNYGDLDRLFRTTIWDYFTLRGTEGVVICSTKTKNAIFVPLAGAMTMDGLVGKDADAYIWISDMFYSGVIYGQALVFTDCMTKKTYERYFGFSVRPVYGK